MPPAWSSGRRCHRRSTAAVDRLATAATRRGNRAPEDRREHAQTQPHSVSPGSVDGPKRTDIVRVCRSEKAHALREPQPVAGRPLGTRPSRPESRRSCDVPQPIPHVPIHIAGRSPRWRTSACGRGCGSSRARSTTSRTPATSTSSASATVGADRARRRRRAARVPERVPAPRQRAVRGHRAGLTEIRCPFHRWTWDLDGRLREVPSRREFGVLERRRAR